MSPIAAEARAAQTAPPDVLSAALPATTSGAKLRHEPAPPPESALNIFDSVMSHSPEIGDFAAALAEAQGKFKAIERTQTAKVDSKRTGVQYSYDYAPLDVVLDATRAALSEAGIAYLQFPSARRNTVTVITMLVHKSGQWFKNILTVGGPEFGDPQAVKSAVTYARRIAYEAMVGVSPSHDDDGGAAQRQVEQQRVRSGQGPVQMPQRQAAAAPPVGAPAVAASTPPAAVSEAAAAPAPAPVTIVALDGSRLSANRNRFWMVELSDGRKACTFSTTIGAALERGFAQHTVYDEIVTHRKDKYLYVDELQPHNGGVS